MKINYLIVFSLVIGIFFISTETFGQSKRKGKKREPVDTLNYIVPGSGKTLEIIFQKGEAFNHPTFAIWIEDQNGRYQESIFVTEYYATGVFGNADAGDGKWSDEKGEAIRPAALPYWSHKRNIINNYGSYVPTPENTVADAVTGATPTGSFVMKTSIGGKFPEKFVVLFEINQTWDWNDYWTNNKYPDDKDYKSSSQPSVIYEAVLSLNKPNTHVTMKPIGHGHYSGKDGLLNKDLSTLTTALEIAGQIQVCILD